MDRESEDRGSAGLSLDDATLRVAVLKVLNDRVSAAFRRAKEEVAAVLGSEGRKNAVLDGQKLASVSVTKPRVLVYDERALTTWVEEHYPGEVETVTKIRPAFLDSIKKATEAAGEPCAPGGELDVPGIDFGEPYPTVRAVPGAADVIEQFWRDGKLTIDGTFKEIE